ncbi:hypothetical protein [Streptomyces malaysiensis]
MASPTVTLVTAAPNPAVAGQSVTLTATVIPSAPERPRAPSPSWSAAAPR